MSEGREEFFNRVGNLATNTYNDLILIPDMRPNVAVTGASLVVYAQALRDVAALDWGGLRWPTHMIERFAAERGIDLTEGE